MLFFLGLVGTLTRKWAGGGRKREVSGWIKFG